MKVAMKIGKNLPYEELQIKFEASNNEIKTITEQSNSICSLLKSAPK